jgi:hypothetical protein
MFGNDASFSDLDLGDPRKANQWRLTPELKPPHMRPFHRATQEKEELVLSDCPYAREPTPQLVEILMQGAAAVRSDQRIGKATSWSARVADLIDIGLGPTFDIAIKC